MTCQEFLVRHTEYLDGMLNPEEVAWCESHIASCASCARYDRVVRQGIDLIRSRPEIEPSADFFPRLQHRLYHLEDELRYGARGPGAGAVVSLAIAGVLALLAWSPMMRLDQVLVPVPGSEGWSAELTEPTNTRPVEAMPSSIRPLEGEEPGGAGWSTAPGFTGAADSWLVTESWGAVRGGFGQVQMSPLLTPQLSVPYTPLYPGQQGMGPDASGVVRTVGDTVSPQD